MIKRRLDGYPAPPQVGHAHLVKLVFVLFAGGVLASCGRIEPCGWDEALVLGASYDVGIVEEYTPETTTAFYSDEFGLTRPAETCGALDGIGVGDEVTIRLVQGASANLRCSMWFAEITSPVLDLGPRNPLIINNTSYNQIVASGSARPGTGATALGVAAGRPRWPRRLPRGPPAQRPTGGCGS